MCGQVNISFVLVTGTAAWPARYWANVESYPKAVTGNGVTLPANSLLLFGGSGTGATYFNDVWGSSDNGRTWVQLANGAYTGTRFPAYAIDSQARLYKIAGGDTSQVWMSTNGVTWAQQQPGSGATTLPPRYLLDAQVDSKDALYVIGGLGSPANDGGMNDGTTRREQHPV